MQTEIADTTQNAKLKIKYAKRNIKMICKIKTKQNKMFEGKDGQNDAHVGATSPILGVSRSWWWSWLCCDILG